MNPSLSLRVGAGMVIVGNVLNIASNAVQPAITDYTNTVEVFTALLATPLWNVSRIGVLFAAMLGAGGLLWLRRAFRGQPGESLFHLAAANALLGVPVIAVMMGLDLAQRQLAGQLLTLPTEALATALWAGHALHYAPFAIFTLSIVLASATPALLGCALLLDKRPPRWIGWSTLLGGSGILVAAIFQAVGGPTPWIINFVIPLFAILITIANLAFGVWLWRRPLGES